MRPQDLFEFKDALAAAAPRPSTRSSREDKKNYAERLSRSCAQLIANRLRPSFAGIVPSPDGSGQESKARTSKGFKKLDVNYSTVELGLGLGVSIKTMNFPDTGGKFGKNFRRIDGELRAEASDYHTRQPYAVLVGVFFLPAESALDAASKSTMSSFARAVGIFRDRTQRRGPSDDPQLFEGFFIGLYDSETCLCDFFDVGKAPPRARAPEGEEVLTLEALIARITEIYDSRNNPPFDTIE
ncbi:MAG: hypothetical protein M9921_14475 [Fimbriimonadaceae bacterium]|nr:hypothetical protein [Chthonomonadaceae bacterium]MCO5298050.1 hypothetical protein [Fimbriimonadaceae bacterium]